MTSISQVSPPPSDQRRFEWDGGAFETARRPRTEIVEGALRPSAPVVMVTLRGGAERHETTTDDGARHDGPDRAGMTSFLPAGCGRRLRLHRVAWRWASLTLRPEALETEDGRRPPGFQPFGKVEDAVVLGLLSEMERLHAADGRLDAAYCDAMAFAVTHYLDRRYWRPAATAEAKPFKLSPWRVKRVCDYVEANLAGEIRIAALAALVGCSEGHFHRAFHATTGDTPLRFIQRRRVERAIMILTNQDVPIARLALQVGFLSPSHFARTFRAVTGRNPSAFRLQNDA